MTPDTVETRIGTLKFFDGLPTKDTTQKAYDNLDFMRVAVSASPTGPHPTAARPPGDRHSV